MKKIVACLSLILFCNPLLTAQEQPVIRIAIGKHDVEHLGGWPLARRWYAVAAQHAKQNGAQAIYFDMAFPSADALHPESDEVFYHECVRDDKIFLMTERVQENNTILGGQSFPAGRTFLPFAAHWQIENAYLIYTPGDHSLVSALTEVPEETVILHWPSDTLLPDMHLSAFLSSNSDLSNRSVVFYFDYPGVTSYVASPQGLVNPVSLIQIWAAEEIQQGRIWKKWPLWLLVVLFGGTAMVSFFALREARWIWIGAPALIWIALVVGLYFSRIYLPTGIGWTFAPILVSTFMLGIKRRSVSVTKEVASATSDDLTDLRYRLNFYEKISDQIRPLDLSECREAQGIYYHKDSSVAELLQKADQVAQSNVPVLITGESGTGKERIAEFIHRRSQRVSGPFVAVNCGAFNDNLIEAELFGYEKGAFTGAVQAKPGRFEMADNGTLFLDEIAETSPAFQVKLLRVLQEGRFERVGGVVSKSVSVRVIAATHRDISVLIRDKQFREDLYYRIAGFVLPLKPLRERTVDIDFLFRQFVYEIAPELKYSDHLVQWLCTLAWPGNVRELKAATQRGVINARMRHRNYILPADFEIRGATFSDSEQSLAERVLHALRDHQFKHRAMSAVADDLGLHRITVTEYFRGWVIKAMIRCEQEPQAMFEYLRGTSDISEPKALKQRIDEYQNNISERIRTGVKKNESPEEVIRLRFRNTPKFFYDDLIQLIKESRHD